MPKTREEYNEYMRTYMLARYHKRRAEWIIQLGSKCVDCGATDSLEFDHDNAAAKAYDLAKIFSYSQQRIQQELAKCVLRCTGCHLAKSRRGGELGGGQNKIPDESYQHGTPRMFFYKKCRCTLCGKAGWMYRSKQVDIDGNPRPGS